MDIEGWGVILTDKESTDLVNEPICSFINGKPIVSTSFMFVEIDMESGNPVPSQATEIDVSEWNTSNVVNMSGMFALSLFKEIDLSNKDLSSVTDMSMMFAGSQAKEVNMNNVDARNVTNIINMFTVMDYETFETIAPCTIETINMSGANFSSVTDMTGMFAYSTSQIIDISNIDARNAASIGGMFVYNTAQMINLSGANFSGAQEISVMVA